MGTSWWLGLCISPQVDPGLINYGFGHYEGEEETDITTPAKTLPWPTVNPSPGTSPTKSQEVPSSSGVHQVVVSPKESPINGIGPRVHVVPASLPSSPLAVPQSEENTHSQEQLELLLSPKTLEWRAQVAYS